MEKFLMGRTVLLTGASRGIGRAIALKLAGMGANLALNARSEKALEGLEIPVKAGLILCPGDLREREVLEKIVRDTVGAFGGLDILINNAGIAFASPVNETSLEDWQKHIEINAAAPFLLCKEALPYLEKSPFATIINISSVVGHKGYENQCAYTASKHALSGFTKALAREVKDKNIRVHLISPGGVATEMAEKTRPDLGREVLIASGDIAETVCFLLSLRGTNAVIDEVRIRRAAGIPWG